MEQEEIWLIRIMPILVAIRGKLVGSVVSICIYSYFKLFFPSFFCSSGPPNGGHPNHHVIYSPPSQPPPPPGPPPGPPPQSSTMITSSVVQVKVAGGKKSSPQFRWRRRKRRSKAQYPEMSRYLLPIDDGEEVQHLGRTLECTLCGLRGKRCHLTLHFKAKHNEVIDLAGVHTNRTAKTTTTNSAAAAATSSSTVTTKKSSNSAIGGLSGFQPTTSQVKPLCFNKIHFFKNEK